MFIRSIRFAAAAASLVLAAAAFSPSFADSMAGTNSMSATTNTAASSGSMSSTNAMAGDHMAKPHKNKMKHTSGNMGANAMSSGSMSGAAPANSMSGTTH